MKQDELEQLLQRADQAAHVRATPPQALADCARQSVRRQRRVRTVYGSCAGLAVVLIVIVSAGTHWNRHEPATTVPEFPTIAVSDDTAISPRKISPRSMASPEALRRRIRELSAEADRRVVLARAMRHVSLQREATPSTPPPRASSDRRSRVRIPTKLIIEQEIEVTARVMIEQAGRWQQNPQHREKVIRYYHRTIKLFPTTAAAKTAKDRLAHLEEQTGATT